MNERDALDEMIRQWIRTVRSGRVRHACGSAEKHYRPASGDLDLLDEQMPNPDSHVPIDVRTGWAVELAWRHIDRLPLRVLLSWHYIRNKALGEACLKAKLGRSNAGVQQKHLAIARKSLIDQLTIVKRRSIISLNRY